MHYALVLILLLATTGVAEDQATFAPPTCDPSRVVGFEQCAKCHTAEVAQWKQTPHHQTFEQLHRTPEAKLIVDKLGLRTVKRNDMCVQCHYTQQQQGSRVRTVSGVSCESCHGEAKDWIDVHADYGGPNVTAATEPPTHRQQRRAAAIAAGMNNPSNL